MSVFPPIAVPPPGWRRARRKAPRCTLLVLLLLALLNVSLIGHAGPLAAPELAPGAAPGASGHGGHEHGGEASQHAEHAHLAECSATSCLACGLVVPVRLTGGGPFHHHTGVRYTASVLLTPQRPPFRPPAISV